MLINTGLSYIRKFFSNVPSDIASLHEIYTSYGLSLEEKDKNRKWLANKQGPLIRLGFIEPKYKGRSLVGLKLTELGKRYLGRSGAGVPPTPIETAFSQNDTKQQSDITQLITKLTQSNPNRKIIYSISDGTISLQ
jgi:hypothetical protein